MSGIELAVALLAIANGSIVLARPVARLHARLDVLEERIRHVAAVVDRIADDV